MKIIVISLVSVIIIRVALVIHLLVNPMSGGPTPARHFVLVELGRQCEVERMAVMLPLWIRVALLGMKGTMDAAMAIFPVLVPMAAGGAAFEGDPFRLGLRTPPSQLQPTHRLRERAQFEGPPRGLGRRGRPGACPPPIGRGQNWQPATRTSRSPFLITPSESRSAGPPQGGRCLPRRRRRSAWPRCGGEWPTA